jgi:hypothetical protein
VTGQHLSMRPCQLFRAHPVLGVDSSKARNSLHKCKLLPNLGAGFFFLDPYGRLFLHNAPASARYHGFLPKPSNGM